MELKREGESAAGMTRTASSRTQQQLLEGTTHAQ